MEKVVQNFEECDKMEPINETEFTEGTMGKVNRNYKASLFSHLFGEPDKEYELYNAIAPGRFPPDTPIRDVTLTDVLYMDRVNDLSYLVGDKLVVFFEHQGSLSENIPLRYLIYCGRVYEMIISNRLMYSERRTTIPTPEFYVLYNGKKPFPEKAVYRLSDSFALPPEGDLSLELVVSVYNVNRGFNDDIIKRSETLSGYVSLVSKVRDFETSGMNHANAVASAIRECIGNGILKEYLESHASEVYNMLLQEWNCDDAKAVWDQETEDRVREIWEPIVAEKDHELAKMGAEIAKMGAEIAQLKAQLKITQ
jgi:hypothetical protein